MELNKYSQNQFLRTDLVKCRMFFTATDCLRDARLDSLFRSLAAWLDINGYSEIESLDD